MTQAFVCLGSNMGDAQAHLAEAKEKISAMTGATITTTAVTNAVNDAIAQYNEIKEGA